ncbi:hypothetical protein EZS27_003085 [termite gut metagenome]|uniref:Uncharacterized protein n=1 Tax=termite gut metagenome TaxID=433724 RepID=A0A5J4SU74_9ZZZZ
MNDLFTLFILVLGLEYQILKDVIKHNILFEIFARVKNVCTFASVFFIVLDLRLTKVGVRRDPFFYV